MTKFKSARELLQQAKDRMSEVANRKRTERSFNVNDLVMLNTKTYKLKKPSPAEKILPRFCCPFRISQRIGLPAYKLVMPPSCKIHPVVHVSKLWLYISRPNDPQPPPPVLLEHADIFEVLDVLSHRGSPKHRQYLVQWKGKDVFYNTWEPKSSLYSCSEVVARYEESALPQIPASQQVYSVTVMC